VFVRRRQIVASLFYTGVDVGPERQQGFFCGLRRNGFESFKKSSRRLTTAQGKQNLESDCVDMLSLRRVVTTRQSRSGAEDCICVNGQLPQRLSWGGICRFRSNNAPKLIDVSSYFIDWRDADKAQGDARRNAYAEAVICTPLVGALR